MNETEAGIAVVAHFTAVAGKEGGLLEALHALLAPTHREPGCIRYELNQEIENPRNFTFAERFASLADFEAHKSMPYMKEFAEKSKDLIESRSLYVLKEMLPPARDERRNRGA